MIALVVLAVLSCLAAFAALVRMEIALGRARRPRTAPAAYVLVHTAGWWDDGPEDAFGPFPTAEEAAAYHDLHPILSRESGRVLQVQEPR